MDTNVAVVANGRADQAGPECVVSCIQALRQIRDGRCLLLDDEGQILQEYRNNLHPSGQRGLGEAFFQWLWNNQANSQHCRMVPVTSHADREFEEFPDDQCLASFDRDDRKFVAVVLASGTSPMVLNASDTDWWHHRRALERHGVRVDFLCRDLMTA